MSVLRELNYCKYDPRSLQRKATPSVIGSIRSRCDWSNRPIHV